MRASSESSSFATRAVLHIPRSFECVEKKKTVLARWDTHTHNRARLYTLRKGETAAARRETQNRGQGPSPPIFCFIYAF